MNFILQIILYDYPVTIYFDSLDIGIIGVDFLQRLHHDQIKMSPLLFLDITCSFDLEPVLSIFSKDTSKQPVS